MADVYLKKPLDMRRALLWTSMLSEPLVSLYPLVGFILHKALGVSLFQLTLLMTLKPVVTVLSFYWGSGLTRHNKLKSNVIWAGIWMRLPFLLCPLFDSSWFIIFASVNYMFFLRAASPAWVEMLKRNLKGESRGRAFSTSSAIGYLEGAALSIGMGMVLNQDPGAWKVLFFFSSLIGLGTVFFQSRVFVDLTPGEVEKISLKERVLRPWLDSYRLLKTRPDFARFQWGFMICGFAIMLIQPVVPLFAVDVLGISYLEMFAALSVAKGLGFALSSPLWSRGLEKTSIFRLASLVFLTVALFPIFLGFSSMNLMWFYAAYFLYGVGQGGSHLVWNMSGPIFAGKDPSSRYTGVGVVLAGLRGGVGPTFGSYLAMSFGSIWALALGGILCVLSSFTLMRFPAQSKIPLSENS